MRKGEQNQTHETNIGNKKKDNVMRKIETVHGHT